jgi:hypothetical protein
MGMEEFSKKSESVEGVSDWREHKEQAPAQAEALLAHIDGFYAMDFGEKRTALNTLIEQLAGNNENRFIARELSVVRARVNEMERHTMQMSNLGVTA